MMTEKSKSVLIITGVNTLISFGYGLSIPFFAIYLNVHKGVPAGLIGLILAFAMLITAFAGMISGEVADAVGRKRVMVASLLIRSILMFAMAVTLYYDTNYIWTVAFHVLGRFVGGFFGPASNAWVADNISSTERVKAFSYIRIGNNFGWALGPAIGGPLAHSSYAAGFALTALMFLIAMFYVSKTIKESLIKTKARKTNFISMFRELKDSNLVRLSVGKFFISMVTSQLVVGLSLHCVNRIGFTDGMVGMLFSIQGLGVVLLQYPVTKIISKIRLTTTLALGSLLYAFGYGYLGFLRHFWPVAVALLVVSLGETFVMPAGESLAANLAPDNKKGRFLGIYMLMQQGGISAGIFMAGMLMQDVSPIYAPGPWIIVGILAAVAAAAFFDMRKNLSLVQDGLKPKQPLPVEDQAVS